MIRNCLTQTVLFLVFILPAISGDVPDLKTVSYAIGYQMGRDFSQSAEGFDGTSLMEGLQDGMESKAPRISEETMRAELTRFQQEFQAREMERRQGAAEKNIQEGKAFLEANGKREGVTSRPSGLQYEVLREGEGASPQPDAMVRTHYQGSLLDGRVFDSSYARGEPVEFQLSSVIQGWREALSLMKPGSKWKIYVPPELAYGPHGAGDLIEPYETLIFEVELLEVL